MKKYILVIAPIFVIHVLTQAQTIENIQVEPVGELIQITYRIGGSLEGHQYDVELECSIDGGTRFHPVSVRGDVGSNIRGGKSYYMIEWEVFKDFEQIGDAEFFIKVNQVADDLPKTQLETDLSKVFFAGYSGSIRTQLGLSGGYISNWGLYLAFRTGFTGHSEMRFSVLAGATKRILEKADFRLYGYGGIGMGDYLDEFAFEAGLMNVIRNRLYLSLGVCVPEYYADLTLGIGIVF